MDLDEKNEKKELTEEERVELQKSVDEGLKLLFSGKAEVNVKTDDGEVLKLSELLRIIVGTLQTLTIDVNNLKGVSNDNKKRKM